MCEHLFYSSSRCYSSQKEREREFQGAFIEIGSGEKVWGRCKDAMSYLCDFYGNCGMLYGYIRFMAWAEKKAHRGNVGANGNWWSGMIYCLRWIKVHVWYGVMNTFLWLTTDATTKKNIQISSDTYTNIFPFSEVLAFSIEYWW